MPEPIAVVVTERPEEGVSHDTIIHTPAGDPDMVTDVTPAWQLALIRALRTTAQQFLTVLGVSQAAPFMPGLSDALPSMDQVSLRLVLLGYMMGTIFLVSLVQNALELSAKWDIRHPIRRG